MYQQHKLQKKSGVNFINILCVRFLFASKLSSFSLVTFGFVIFGTKILYEKWTHKTLMKLNTGLCNALSASGGR